MAECPAHAIDADNHFTPMLSASNGIRLIATGKVFLAEYKKMNAGQLACPAFIYANLSRWIFG